MSRSSTSAELSSAPIEQSSTKYSFYSAEATGDIISDTIYERNRKIEERFNVTFAPTISEWYTDISRHVKQSVMAERTTMISFSVRYSTPPRSR